MRHRARALRLLIVAVTAPLIFAAACGGGSTATSASSDATTPAPAEKAGGEGGGEAAGIRFESPRHHYRVSAPGAMAEASDGTASSSSGAEQLSITVVGAPAAANPAAYAAADLKTVSTTVTNYALMAPPADVKLTASASALKAVYSATEGPSAVTGKAENVVAVRYYVPRDPSTLAVLTYTVTANQYDPQGADDVANTFGWV